MFLTQDEAELWAGEYERDIRLTGLPPTIEALKKHTVGDITLRYLKEMTPAKGCCVSETAVLNKFLKRDICSMSLASFRDKQEGYKYVSDRLKESWKSPGSKGKAKPITPRTIRREVNTIQHVFEVAKERWGMTNLFNPFRELEIKGSSHKRRRALQPGELEKLLEACKDCRGLNRYYVPLAIYLAIETAMRLQEIFNLAWGDVNIQTRRIEIRKSKTDHVSDYEGRTIVLTCMAMYLLDHGEEARPAAAKLIFPMTKGAFEQSWADVRKRAGIEADRRGEILEFKDLRREAGNRFEKAGLSKLEHDLMLGHADKSMRGVYISPEGPLKSIQDKLDRHTIGMTFDEAVIHKERSDPRMKEIRKLWGGREPVKPNVVPFHKAG
jgi:integrase